MSEFSRNARQEQTVYSGLYKQNENIDLVGYSLQRTWQKHLTVEKSELISDTREDFGNE